MKLICQNSSLRGEVEIPGSKSHTIRAVAIAALASGESSIREPLDSEDTRSALKAYEALGAEIEAAPGLWKIKGTGGNLSTPEDIIDVGNSGTSLRIVMGSAALLKDGVTVFTGDHQIRSRPAGPLAQSLCDLGASVRSTRNNGCAPFVVEGCIRGGATSIEAITSQYLSSLLMCTPLADNDTIIKVPLLNEQPYVEITLDWLNHQGIQINWDDMTEFRVPGGQSYLPVERRIPCDFSSATFFLVAGALADNDVISVGLDMADTQGDKAVVDYLRQMGADITIEEDRIHVKAGKLSGCEIDLNATPDALPMMAVVGCLAEGTTRLVNVPQARFKETDRISVMKKELEKMGADIEELSDGLVIRQSELKGAEVEGHDDHRVVMSLAIAGTQSSGTTIINGYEAVSITYPGFIDALSGLGGNAHLDE